MADTRESHRSDGEPGDFDEARDGAANDPATTVVRTRGGPDPFALVVGLLTLAMAVAAFVGKVPDLTGFDPRWLLAAAAALFGLLLLAGSLRSRRR